MVRIDRTQKEADAKFEEARKIREENPNDPSIPFGELWWIGLKTLLKEIADKRKELDSYRVAIISLD